MSSPQEEGVLRVSKWIKIQVLLDESEMEALLAHLDPLIFCVSEVVEQDHSLISQSEFLSKYKSYVAALKHGKIPEELLLKRYFSSVFSATPDVLYAMKVGPEKYLIKALKPVIQIQLHHFFMSTIDGKFHPMVLGEESVTWGLQFSYPQLFQDPKTLAFSKVINTPDFPNTELFLKLTRWIRAHTTATPFVREGIRVNVPMRLGKQCFSWINAHPQLPLKGLKVFDLS